jgi:hypothetical protein
MAILRTGAHRTADSHSFSSCAVIDACRRRVLSTCMHMWDMYVCIQARRMYSTMPIVTGTCNHLALRLHGRVAVGAMLRATQAEQQLRLPRDPHRTVRLLRRHPSSLFRLPHVGQPTAQLLALGTALAAAPATLDGELHHHASTLIRWEETIDSQSPCECHTPAAQLAPPPGQPNPALHCCAVSPCRAPAHCHACRKRLPRRRAVQAPRPPPPPRLPPAPQTVV